MSEHRYELLPIHTLATTKKKQFKHEHAVTSYPLYILWLPPKKNNSNMNTQSSPCFDPFSAPFIKHAEETVWDDRGKSHTENVLLPLLSDLLVPSASVRRCHPTSLAQSYNHASTQERSNYIPTELSLAGNQWLYLQTSCKRGQGFIDGLGSC